MKETYVYQDEISLKEKIIFFFKIFFIGIIFEALIILILYILIYSSFFQIKEIKIHNLDYLSERELMDFIIIKLLNNSFINKILGFNNILIWPEVLNNDLNNFYIIKNIEIKKKYLEQKIDIFVNERKSIGLWCSQNQCWEFDKDGILFKKTFLSEGTLITKIFDYSSRDLGLGSKVLPDKFLNIFLTILNMLQKENIIFSNIRIENIDLQEIKVQTINGPDIYFSLRFNPPDIGEIINNFKNKNIFDKLEYLDLRIENRLYYK